jgi:hypothetical protein
VADGTAVLWEDGGRWLVDDTERGTVDRWYAFVFDSEAAACRWLFDRFYLGRYGNAASHYLRYLEDLGDDQANAWVPLPAQSHASLTTDGSAQAETADREVGVGANGAETAFADRGGGVPRSG